MTMKHDPYNLVVCGVGGQGNILIARMIGRLLVAKGYRVNIGETFGAAQRGGSVYSSLRLSRKGHYGPLIPKGMAHMVVGLEPLETLRLLNEYGNQEVAALSNTTPIQPVGVLAGRNQYPAMESLLESIKDLSANAWFVDATGLALGMGAPIVANIVLMGALLGTGQLPISREEVEREMAATFPADKLALNLSALEAGRQAV